MKCLGLKGLASYLAHDNYPLTLFRPNMRKSEKTNGRISRSNFDCRGYEPKGQAFARVVLADYEISTPLPLPLRTALASVAGRGAARKHPDLRQEVCPASFAVLQLRHIHPGLGPSAISRSTSSRSVASTDDTLCIAALRTFPSPSRRSCKISGVSRPSRVGTQVIAATARSIGSSPPIQQFGSGSCTIEHRVWAAIRSWSVLLTSRGISERNNGAQMSATGAPQRARAAANAHPRPQANISKS